VESIALKVGSFPVYNLEVAGAHTYFVGQQELLVHNGCQSYLNQLVLTGNQARAKLRSAMQTVKGAVAHHVIPWEARSHPLVQKAAKGGFNMNGSNNGVSLGPDQHWTSHPHYNEAVLSKLDNIMAANPNISDAQAAKLIQDYANQLSEGISKSGAELK